MDEPAWWKVENNIFDYHVMNTIEGHVYMLAKNHMWFYKTPKAVILEYVYRKIYKPKDIFNFKYHDYNTQTLLTVLHNLHKTFPLKRVDHEQQEHKVVVEKFEDCEDLNLRQHFVELGNYLKKVIDTIRDKKRNNFDNIKISLVPPELLPYGIPSIKIFTYLIKYTDNYTSFALDYYKRCLKSLHNVDDLSWRYIRHMNIRATQIISYFLFGNSVKITVDELQEYIKSLNILTVKFNLKQGYVPEDIKWYLGNVEYWENILHLPMNFDPWPEVTTYDELLKVVAI